MHSCSIILVSFMSHLFFKLWGLVTAFYNFYLFIFVYNVFRVYCKVHLLKANGLDFCDCTFFTTFKFFRSKLFFSKW